MTTMEEMQKELERLTLEMKSREVYFPPKEKKIRPFNGKDTMDVICFVEDIKAGIKLRKLIGESAINYVLAHLEGPARQEVQHRSDSEKKDAEAILNILLDAFGDKRTVSQLMRDLYNRIQMEEESVAQYGYALLALTTQIQRKPDAPEIESILKEQFRAGLIDPVLRREVKRLTKEKPELSFLKIRDWAVEMDDEEKGGYSRKKKCTSNQAEAKLEIGKMVEGLAEAIKGQTLLLDKVIAQQGAFNSRLDRLEQDTARRGRRDQSTVECYRCHQMGHYATQCNQAAVNQQQGN